MEKIPVPWRTNYFVSKKKLRKLTEEEILKCTKDPDPKFERKQGIADHVKKSTRYVSEVQNKLSKTCQCRHMQDEHIENKCQKCQCIEYRSRLTLSETGRIIKPKISYDQILEQEIGGQSFIKQREIQKLIDYQKARQKPWATPVSRCFVVCKSIGNSPRQIMEYEEDDGNGNRKKDPYMGLTKAMLLFREHMNNNTVQYINSKIAKMWNPEGKEKGIEDYINAMRLLYRANGTPVPEGYGGKDHILTVSVKTSGAYNDVQWTDKQFYEMMDYIESKYGFQAVAMYACLDEFVARTDEGFNWVVNLQIKKKRCEDGNEYEYGLVKGFYSDKTSDYWTKVVIDPKVLSILRKLPFGEKIYPVNKKKYKSEFTKIMRDALSHIGLLPKGVLLSRNDPERPRFEKSTELYKLDKDPAGSLRHDGSHRSSRRNNGDLTKLTSRGWNSSETTIKYYAKQNADVEDDICMYCRPSVGFDPNNLPDNLHFCREQHALIFLNNGHQPKKPDESTQTILSELTKTKELLNQAQQELEQTKNQKPTVSEVNIPNPAVPIIPKELLTIPALPDLGNGNGDADLSKYDTMSYEELYAVITKLGTPKTVHEIKLYEYINNLLRLIIEKTTSST